MSFIEFKGKEFVFNHHLSLPYRPLVVDEKKSIGDGDLDGNLIVKDLLGPGPIVHPGLLFTAWVAWGISIISTLASFFFSQLALRTAIRQVDDGTIGGQYPGRAYARVTVGLNALGGIMFLVGVGFIVWFVALNLGGLHGAQASPGR